MKKLIGMLFLISQVTLASAIASLDGKMYGKTEKTFSIFVKGNIYYLDRKQLSEDQIKDLDKTPWNSPVSVRVPLTAIQDVKTAKAK